MLNAKVRCFIELSPGTGRQEKWRKEVKEAQRLWSVICLFINVLHEILKKHKMTDMISFVDPVMIGALGCGTPVERNHWALSAVNPKSQVVYQMDPLKRRIATEEWIEVVDNGIKLYKDKAKKILKKKIEWENLAGVPLQTGTKDCVGTEEQPFL
ncbi:hypothetical protein POM88_023581 [Heracleum sosnowskyi]|uniref:Ubiquitin-like protease family profile domain-containing protein n=1 Tax=Heracleum sosnowskyi TaxID=360622 RepID=A0AAD8MUK5_9APIA|nr:hypothetical protein POM88_023581 [Heracleum sosnowskyi]